MAYRITETGDRVTTEDGLYYLVTEDHSSTPPSSLFVAAGDSPTLTDDEPTPAPRMNLYTAGQLVSVRASFLDQDDAGVDPTGVVFRVRSPAGVTTSYVYETDEEVVRTGSGRYRIDVEAALPGLYFYRWEGTGVGQGVAEGGFRVEASRVL